MTVYEFFSGIFIPFPTDKERAAEQLARRFPSCEWCPFVADRDNGECFNLHDHACCELARDLKFGKTGVEVEEVDRLLRSREARCLSKLRNWLDTEFSYSSSGELCEPDED